MSLLTDRDGPVAGGFLSVGSLEAEVYGIHMHSLGCCTTPGGYPLV